MLRRLNGEGLRAMHEWLDEAARTAHAIPIELTSSDRFSEPTGIDRELVNRSFSSRLEWGLHALELFSSSRVAEIASDAGLWSWLTLKYFDQLCPMRASGERTLGQRARYVPTGSDYRTYYRHLLAGPWRVVVAHADDPSRASGLLAGPLNRPGELYEQIASRMELATSVTVLPVVNALYFNAAEGSLKRGAGGSGRGSPRRLADVLMQLDLTFDIYAMPVHRLLGMLPAEFDRFRPSTG